MRPRAVLLGGLVIALALAAPSVSAEPVPAHVGQVTTVSATFRLLGSDHRTYFVALTARHQAYVQQPERLDAAFEWRSCTRDRAGRVTCRAPQVMSLHTAPTAFAIAEDGQTARLNLGISGRPVQLTWTRSPDDRAFRLQADDTGIEATDPTRSGPARVVGEVFGARHCEAVGAIEVAHTVSTQDPPGSGTQARALPSAVIHGSCLAPA